MLFGFLIVFKFTKDNILHSHFLPALGWITSALCPWYPATALLPSGVSFLTISEQFPASLMILYHRYTRANMIHSKPFSTFFFYDEFVKPSNHEGGLWAILIFFKENERKKLCLKAIKSGWDSTINQSNWTAPANSVRKESTTAETCFKLLPLIR